jgi:serine/threonine protein kinase
VRVEQHIFEANVQIGDFRIEKRLGSGGMGVVYLARQLSLDRLVALKILGSALNDPSDLTRFQREAQAIARLHHPGIATVYFIGQDTQACYIALEFIDGPSLRRVMQHLSKLNDPPQEFDTILKQISTADGQAPVVRFDQPTETFKSQPQAGAEAQVALSESLTPEASRLLNSPSYVRRCCVLGRDAALALAHAHERGVTHRDIKPENVMLDRQGQIHIIDFGLARFFEDVTITNTGALVGTPMYMSPEQVTGRLKVDSRTDIYSLGLVLYECLTLRRPIAAPTREGVFRKIVTKALPPLASQNPAVSRALEGVVHKATAKDPDDRYQDAKEFASDLQGFLDGTGVKARPYRYKFDHREIYDQRPMPITLLGYCFYFLAAGSLVASFGEFVLAGESRKKSDILAYMVAGVLACLLGWMGKGLHGGRKAARTAALVAFSSGAMIQLVLFVVACMGYVVLLIPTGTPIKPDVYREFRKFIVADGLGIGIILYLQIIIVSKSTREWFRFAELVRAEHKRRA